MNASLQCLLRVRPLTEYFAGDDWRSTLNRTNALGSGGPIASAHHSFCKSMMHAGQSTFSASQLHSAVGQHCATLNNYAHEFMMTLLDALAEDVNHSERSQRGHARPVSRGSLYTGFATIPQFPNCLTASLKHGSSTMDASTRK
jgi:ubiquitin C-terminal hydrolase